MIALFIADYSLLEGFTLLFELLLHDVFPLYEKDNEIIVNRKNSLQATVLLHDRRIKGMGKFVFNNNVKLSSLADMTAWSSEHFQHMICLEQLHVQVPRENNKLRWEIGKHRQKLAAMKSTLEKV